MFLGIGDTLLAILAFVIILGAIIIIHEGGHFFFATRAGILCREYAFGMGPLLWKKKKGETLYSLRLLPIGGFCAICGEESESDPLKELKKIRVNIREDGIIDKIYLPTDGKNPVNLFDDKPQYKLVNYDLFDANDTGELYMTLAPIDSSDEDESQNVKYQVARDAYYVFGVGKHADESVPKEKRLEKCVTEYQIGPHDRTLDSKKFGQRFMVMFGGPLMNFVLAIIAFFIGLCITGVANTKSNVVADFEIDDNTALVSPLYNEGVRGGDKITKLVAGSLSKDVKSWNDISDFMDSYRALEVKSDVTVTYERGGVASTATVSPMVYIYSISMVQDISKPGVVVGSLDPKSKAYQGGVREGDEITTIIIKDTTYTIANWFDVYNAFSCDDVIGGDTDVKIIVNRTEEGTTKVVDDIVVRPYSKKLFDKTQSVGIVDMKLGITCTNTHNIFGIVRGTFTQMWSSIKQLFNTLGMLIFSKSVGIKDLSGPVGIFTMTKSALGGGIGNLFYWCGFLSVNVGFMNLLPIPALDGGRILFLIIEKIKRKPVSRKAQDIAINVTYYALLALILYVTFNDVLRIVKK